MTNVPKKLPAHAKKVFQGKLFEVWQWDQEMFDGSTTVFERVKRPDTVEIIATVGDKIVIEKESQPHYQDALGLPCGRADQGDDMLAEAKRELREETGYASDDWQLWASISPADKVIQEVHFFIARDCRKVGEQELDPGERIEVRLVDLDGLLALADEPRFLENQWFVSELLRMRLDPAKKEAFRRLLFPGPADQLKS